MVMYGSFYAHNPQADLTQKETVSSLNRKDKTVLGPVVKTQHRF